jgi:hypothetical protein
MPESYWTLMVAGRSGKKYPNREEATEAAKQYLRDNPSVKDVPIHEIDEKGHGKRGRIVFKYPGDIFHYVDTEWVK